MSVFDRIATLVPSNRAAAIGMQVGVGEPDLTPQQMRENLLSALRKADADIAAHPKGAPGRKDLVARKFAVQAQLTEIKASCLGGVPTDRSLSDLILDVVKERTPKPIWQSIVREAERRFVERAAKGDQS